MRRFVYLDYSATTPMDERVVAAMLPYMSDFFGNSSSSHQWGRKAARAVEDARQTIAHVLNCKPSEVVFTSGGSESDNLALRGIRYSETRHTVCTTPIEHSAIGQTAMQLSKDGMANLRLLRVDQFGQLDLEAYTESIDTHTALVSVMYANNEIGTLQDIPTLAVLAHERGALFHTDAVQAAGQLSLDVETLGVDMLSISAHKFYGPKGVGALYIREGTALYAAQTGGSHENGLRAGTLNTPGIVGMAKALELAYQEQEARLAHYHTLRMLLVDGVLGRIEGAILTGHPEQRLPSHASFVFDGIESNQLLMHLDMKGIGASSASACKTGNPEPSSVLLALGYSRELALGSLRLSVGRMTSEEDIAYVVDALSDSVAALRQLRQGHVR